MLTSLLLTSPCDFIFAGQHLQDKCLSIPLPFAESLYMDSAILMLLTKEKEADMQIIHNWQNTLIHLHKVSGG